MSEEPRTRIVIVGGGTAGWMAAAVLARSLPAARYAITLVESEEIGTIGVGEATIPQLQLLNAALGFDEFAFMRATEATYKLGIEFVGWGAAESRYIHAFGAVGRQIGEIPFQHFWLRGRQLGESAALNAYSLNAAAAYSGRFERAGRSRAGGSRMLGDLAHAFHFDAGLFAKFLRSFAEARGVRRIEGRIVTAERAGESGEIAAVVLESGARVAGELFFDCSGFGGLLIEEALGTGYESWTDLLPCDRAVAVQCDPAPELTPYTRSSAHTAGWQWRIPLQNRIGNGHVFCSAAIGEDEATATLLANLDGAPRGDPRVLRFTTGRRKAFWNRNVIALGLAAGFLEPLESTSIHLVQSALERVLRYLPNGPIRAADVDAYNRQTVFEWERVRDFIVLHYHANTRPEPFWRQCAAMAMPESLTHKLALFRANGRIQREADELFAEVGWLQVLVGQGIVPAGYHPLVDAHTPEEVRELLGLVRQAVARQVAAMPGHAEFIAAHCAA